MDNNGNFNSAPFLKLIDSCRGNLKSGKKGSQATKRASKPLVIGGISPKEVWEFIHKLGNFLGGGIDLKTALALLHKQIKNPKFKYVIHEMRLNLDQGIPVSDTLKQFTRYFDSLIIATVEVGEKTGTLPRVLIELDKRLLETIQIKSKIRGAMIYPAVLMFLTLSMVTFMMTFIIPKVTVAFTKTGVELPGLTQFIVNISNFLILNYVAIIICLVIFIFLLVVGGRTYTGQVILSWIKMRIPVFGFIEKQGNIILFIDSFSLLLDSGVLVLEALETTALVVPNIFYKKDIIRTKNEVEAGIKLSNAMGLTMSNKEVVFSNFLFPEDLVHMISVGEETGSVGKTIQRVGEIYQSELKSYISNLMTMLEPIIIVTVGALVGTIVIAIMLPFFAILKVVKKM